MQYYFVKGSMPLAGDEIELEKSIPIPENGYMIQLLVSPGKKAKLRVKTATGKMVSARIDPEDLGAFELANIAGDLLHSIGVNVFVRPARYAIAYRTSDTTVYVDMDQ
jgi:hypothetical protein